MPIGLIIKQSWAVDADGNKLDDPKDVRREGVHYIYENGTEATLYNKYVLNPDGTRETKAQKFKRLYGLDCYDETLSWSQNVYKICKNSCII